MAVDFTVRDEGAAHLFYDYRIGDQLKFEVTAWLILIGENEVAFRATGFQMVEAPPVAGPSQPEDGVVATDAR